MKIELIHCSWYCSWRRIRNNEFSKKNTSVSGHDEIGARHIEISNRLIFNPPLLMQYAIYSWPFPWLFECRQKTFFLNVAITSRWITEELSQCYLVPLRFWINPFMITWWHSLINSKVCMIFNSLIGKHMVMISITVYDQMIMVLQHGSYSIGVYIDFVGIFDTMNHVISFTRLQYQRNCLKMSQNLFVKLVSLFIPTKVINSWYYKGTKQMWIMCI